VVFAALQQANSPATAVPILQLFGEIVILCRAHGSAFPEGQVSEQGGNSAPRRFKTVMNPRLPNQLQHWNHRFPKPHPCNWKSALNSDWN
jgi:hypothetical protein